MVEDIGHARAWVGAIGEQRVAPRGSRRGDRTRHDQHFAAVLERQIGRDACPAAGRRLDYHRCPRQRGDDPVALGKVPASNLGSGLVLSDQRSGSGDSACQRDMLPWVNWKQSAGEHGDRHAPRIHAPAVRGDVDAARQPRDHDQAGSSQICREACGYAATVGGTGAGTNHRDTGATGESPLHV